MTSKSKAERLRELHGGAQTLVLVNAWDAIGARIVAAEGFPAVATSSAGCAAVLGYPDGQRIPRPEMMFLIAKIAGSVDVPVTADVEAGYGDPVQTALDLIAAGVVGMNLEDYADGAPIPLDRQVERVRAVRAAADASGVSLVINARTDVWLERIGNPAERFDRGVERLNAYRDAGADCLFAPGVADAATIERLVRAVRGPLNVLATVGSPPIGEMERMGVARVSFGSGTSRVALGAMRRFVREVRDQGTFPALAGEAIPYAEVQQLLKKSRTTWPGTAARALPTGQ